jgi:hypothetical protein
MIPKGGMIDTAGHIIILKILTIGTTSGRVQNIAHGSDKSAELDIHNKKE